MYVFMFFHIHMCFVTLLISGSISEMVYEYLSWIWEVAEKQTVKTVRVELLDIEEGLCEAEQAIVSARVVCQSDNYIQLNMAERLQIASFV